MLKLGRIVSACAGLALLATAWPLGSSAQSQKPADAKRLFERRCGGCHALDIDSEGPHLRGVYGRAAGSVDSFSYSSALKHLKITWNDETLEQWLEDPEKVAPNNDMSFRVPDAEERRIIIGYLKELSGK